MNWCTLWGAWPWSTKSEVSKWRLQNWDSRHALEHTWKRTQVSTGALLDETTYPILPHWHSHASDCWHLRYQFYFPWKQADSVGCTATTLTFILLLPSWRPFGCAKLVKGVAHDSMSTPVPAWAAPLLIGGVKVCPSELPVMVLWKSLRASYEGISWEEKRVNVEDLTFLLGEAITYPENAPATSMAELTRLACVKPSRIDRGVLALSLTTSAVLGYI